MRNTGVLATTVVIATLAALALIAVDREAVPQASISSAFDHFTTGFPLEGAHRRASCRACHGDDLAAALPRGCVGCHRDPHVGRLGSRCDQCHDADLGWRASFDAFRDYEERGEAFRALVEELR